MINIGIIDDDALFLDMLSEFFNDYTCNCFLYSSELLKNNPDSFDLLIVDQVMPNINGIDIIKSVREHSNVPIIMMSSISHEHRLVEGLNAGADDYVLKPLNLPAMRARVIALLRRSNFVDSSHRLIKINEFIIDNHQMTVTDKDGQCRKVGATAFRLLSFFIEYPNTILSREELHKMLRGTHYDPLGSYIDVQIRRLRLAFGPYYGKKIIVNVRGSGFLLDGTISSVPS